ncbi:MAG: hypothetical protein KKA62_03445 [Nanoarchaeota archaeon]|nr:hypothetical protein [Nanoarchaeota archaeon]MBU1644584.1 hypothetical protein [Nanoarchaeota archaeon]MBU1976980.1 hypothetical protein [Nanoarchaeota archaeon]
MDEEIFRMLKEIKRDLRLMTGLESILSKQKENRKDILGASFFDSLILDYFASNLESKELFSLGINLKNNQNQKNSFNQNITLVVIADYLTGLYGRKNFKAGDFLRKSSSAQLDFLETKLGSTMMSTEKETFRLSTGVEENMTLCAYLSLLKNAEFLNILSGVNSVNDLKSILLADLVYSHTVSEGKKQLADRLAREVKEKGLPAQRIWLELLSFRSAEMSKDLLSKKIRELRQMDQLVSHTFSEENLKCNLEERKLDDQLEKILQVRYSLNDGPAKYKIFEISLERTVSEYHFIHEKVIKEIDQGFKRYLDLQFQKYNSRKKSMFIEEETKELEQWKNRFEKLNYLSKTFNNEKKNTEFYSRKVKDDYSKAREVLEFKTGLLNEQKKVWEYLSNSTSYHLGVEEAKEKFFWLEKMNENLSTVFSSNRLKTYPPLENLCSQVRSETREAVESVKKNILRSVEEINLSCRKSIEEANQRILEMKNSFFLSKPYHCYQTYLKLGSLREVVEKRRKNVEELSKFRPFLDDSQKEQFVFLEKELRNIFLTLENNKIDCQDYFIKAGFGIGSLLALGSGFVYSLF